MKWLMPLRDRARTIAIVGAIWMIMLAVTAAPSSVAADPTPSPNPSDFTCALPALPHGVTGSSSSTTKLSGPAVSALTGGAARHGFSLDGGDLVVQPPRRGDVPLLSAHQAICGASASTGDLSASAAQGVAGLRPGQRGRQILSCHHRLSLARRCGRQVPDGGVISQPAGLVSGGSYISHCLQLPGGECPSSLRSPVQRSRLRGVHDRRPHRNRRPRV